MRLRSMVLALSLTLVWSSARALECGEFNFEGQLKNSGKLLTAHGFIQYDYSGKFLQVTRRRLSDNTFAIGAVPANLPLQFVFIDRSGAVRETGRALLNYVTEPTSEPGKIEFYGAQNNLIATESVPRYPFLVHTQYSYTAGSLAIARTALTLSRAIIEGFCVEPGARVNITRKELLRHMRSR
jgi:hypothetical protein